MEKKISLIVDESSENLRVDVFINNKESNISRTRIKNLILRKKYTTDICSEDFKIHLSIYFNFWCAC